MSKLRSRSNHKLLNGHVSISNGETDGCLKCASSNINSSITSRRSTRRRTSSSVNLDRTKGEHDDHSSYLAENGSPPGSVFKFYSQFGYYWNYFPKTDYTYAPSSPLYKKEIAPGIPIVPNLSRKAVGNRKLDSSSGYECSVADNSSENGSFTTCRNHSSYSKDDEVGESRSSSVVTVYRYIRTVVTTTVSTVTSTMTSVVTAPASTLVTRPTSLLLPLFFLLLLLLLLLTKGEDSPVTDAVIAKSLSPSGFSPYQYFVSACRSAYMALVNAVKWTSLLPYYFLSLFSNFSAQPPATVNCDKYCDICLNSIENMRREIESVKKDLNGLMIDEVRIKVNTLEHNVATLKTDIKDTKKTLTETTPSDRYLSTFSEDGSLKLYIDSAIAKYHADRISKPDFALQSMGAEVVSIRCTQTHYKPGFYFIYGLPTFMDKKTTPETAITPGTMPGECWAFEGEQGHLVVKLASRVRVTGFTIDHAPKEILPNQRMTSAPKDFLVLGLNDLYDPDPFLLGQFRFVDNGQSIQTFEAKETNKSFELVELEILSNHGHMVYTCLYRFRVHGVPIDKEQIYFDELL